MLGYYVALFSYTSASCYLLSIRYNKIRPLDESTRNSVQPLLGSGSGSDDMEGDAHV